MPTVESIARVIVQVVPVILVTSTGSCEEVPISRMAVKGVDGHPEEEATEATVAEELIRPVRVVWGTLVAYCWPVGISHLL
jgi:hypothetical protein